MSIKETIHHLVENCEDEAILFNTLETLQKQLPKTDWWNELSDAQKEKTKDSLKQSVNGETISHEVVMQKVWEKFTN